MTLRNEQRQLGFIDNHAYEGCSKCTCPILIIEDQKSIAQLMEAIIKDRYGYATIIAASLAEAEAAIASQCIHLAISDLNLPDAPYGEIIDLLSHHKISTIALTGAFGHELRETILKKGAIDYIPKQSVHAIEYAVEMANRIYENHHTDVLVVDDSLSSRAVLKHILEKLQFNVLTASNGTEALSIIETRPEIRLALIDYEMPGMNGFQLIHEIRKSVSKEELAIIGVSASDSGEVSAQFLKSGANDFVRKPYSYEEILCRIGQNLEVLELIRRNRRAAYLDFLTGVHNRRFFFQEGSRLHKQISSHAITAVAAMLDVDHFKKINDTYGHDCGDAVLKEFAGILSRHFRKNLLARVGGEEFAVILENVSLEEAHVLLEKCRHEVETTPVMCGPVTITYTMSVGLSCRAGATIDEFIKAADHHLYAAKRAGRNCIVSD